ncbi:Hypothetical predicted protein [Olea europaea subsp. europaea]|uniref:Uncharacterized protein n=1 Tax=Olea europaea subsp. europaea TaxID=158383 RepID=A0A8S0QII0_OLEEU|nr:Hypothetical predicted protein [Olea europaea subsp. europaea]
MVVNRVKRAVVGRQFVTGGASGVTLGRVADRETVGVAVVGEDVVLNSGVAGAAGSEKKGDDANAEMSGKAEAR